MLEDFAEERARKWLEGQEALTVFRYVSDTNDQPPDFVVNNHIGVEVRRLNWMDDSGEGVESIEYALRGMVEEMLAQAGRPPGGFDVYVKCQTHGVLLKTRKNKSDVKRSVAEFVDQYCKKIAEALKSDSRPRPWITEFKHGIRLRFSTGLISDTGKYELVDVEAEAGSRGWTIPDSIDNIYRCIEGKTGKIQKYINKHCEWWLILVAHNLYPPGICEHDRWQEIRNQLVDTEPWSRIIVLSQIDPNEQVDLV